MRWLPDRAKNLGAGGQCRALTRRSVIAGALTTVASGAVAQDFNQQSWVDRILMSPDKSGVSPPVARPIETKRLVAPDFAALHIETAFVAAVRPHRGGGMRLALGRALETSSGHKVMVHNYGHGGAGLSLAFGAAETARGLIARAISERVDKPHIAILGAGVIGLTTALAVKERWPDATVTIYAKQHDPQQTTSYWAGGQFAVASSLQEYQSPSERKLLQHHLDLSEQHFAKLSARGRADRFGIARRTAYSLTGQGVRLILGKNTVSASSYGSWLIDPTRLLPALQDDLKAHGVRFIHRNFETHTDLAALPEPVIVNCTGAGAGPLLDDQQMRPCRGHLVLLKNPGKLDYFLNTWCGAGRVSHIFARHDDIVLGGSLQWEPTGDTFDPENPNDVRICERILRNARGVFEERGQGRCS